MITDNGDDFSCVQAIEDNIDGSLSKPFCSRQMTAALDISCISAEKVARSPKTQKKQLCFPLKLNFAEEKFTLRIFAYLA